METLKNIETQPAWLVVGKSIYHNLVKEKYTELALSLGIITILKKLSLKGLNSMGLTMKDITNFEKNNPALVQYAESMRQKFLKEEQQHQLQHFMLTIVMKRKLCEVFYVLIAMSFLVSVMMMYLYF